MECSICFESATASTGFTQLACSHTFHLKCIVTWLSKASSCPCCRAEPNENEAVQGAVALKNEVDEVNAKYHDLVHRSKMAISVMRDEKNRLENLVAEAMTGKEKQLFLFSKELERIIPSIFRNVVHSDDGEGGEVIFPAFLPLRLDIAEHATTAPKWASLYAAFSNGTLHRLRLAAAAAAVKAKANIRTQELADKAARLQQRRDAALASS